VETKTLLSIGTNEYKLKMLQISEKSFLVTFEIKTPYELDGPEVRATVTKRDQETSGSDSFVGACQLFQEKFEELVKRGFLTSRTVQEVYEFNGCKGSSI